MRWNLQNGVSLCWPCHRNIAHGDPEKFRDFLIGWLTEPVYDFLKDLAYDTDGPKGDPSAVIEGYSKAQEVVFPKPEGSAAYAFLTRFV
jgi:hypothetical protein